MSIKIVFYQPSFNGGGAERNGVLLASQLARNGYAVFLVVDEAEGPNAKLVDPLVKVERLPSGGHLSDIRELRKCLRRIRPDYIYTNGGLSPFKAMISCLGLVHWRNIAAAYHSLYEVINSWGGYLMFWAAPLLSRLVKTVAVSNAVKRQLVDRFNTKFGAVQVIANPVDLAMMLELAEREPSIKFDEPFLLCAARFVDQKNLDVLISAFAELAAEIPHHLILIGDGPCREGLISQARRLGVAERVHMPGYIDNPFPIYARAAAFVLPSSFEPFGNVVVEALSFGVTPVAIKGSAGPDEILLEGRFGYLAAGSTAATLASAVLDAIHKPFDPAALIDRSKAYSLPLIAEEYLGLFGLPAHALTGSLRDVSN